MTADELQFIVLLAAKLPLAPLRGEARALPRRNNQHTASIFVGNGLCAVPKRAVEGAGPYI